MAEVGDPDKAGHGWLVVLLGCDRDRCLCCNQAPADDGCRVVFRGYTLGMGGRLQEEGIVICPSCYLRHGAQSLLITLMNQREAMAQEVLATREACLVADIDKQIRWVMEGRCHFPGVPANAFCEAYGRHRVDGGRSNHCP